MVFALLKAWYDQIAHCANWSASQNPIFLHSVQAIQKGVSGEGLCLYVCKRRSRVYIYLVFFVSTKSYSNFAFALLGPSALQERYIPVGIWWQNDVVLMSMRRPHVASTLIRRHFYVMCPLGQSISILQFFISVRDNITKTKVIWISPHQWFRKLSIRNRNLNISIADVQKIFLLTDMQICHTLCKKTRVLYIEKKSKLLIRFFR